MSETGSQDLDGVSVAAFVAPEGTEDVELEEPKRALADAGADVDVVSSEEGEVETVENDLEGGDTYEVDRTFSEAAADEYDALLLPGGTVGADRIRGEDDAVELVRDHAKGGKPIGSICHGPWALVEAGVVDGRTLTSYPSLETDVENAGGEWVDEEVVVDDGLVTSRDPDDLEAFCEAIVEEFAAG